MTIQKTAHCNYTYSRIVRFVWYFLFAIGMQHTALAQAEPDSHALEKTDSVSILQLISTGESFTESNPPKAYNLLTDALERSKTIHYNKGIALASAKLGQWYFGNDIEKSIQLNSTALQIFEENQIGDKIDIANIHLSLAEAYDEQGHLDSSAYYYYLLGMEMDDYNISNPEFAVKVYTKLAIFWINLDNGDEINDEYKKTIQRYVDKARTSASSIKDTADAKSSIYFLQGAYYHAINQFDSARYFYNSYLAERERIKKLTVIRKISTLFNIADTYLRENNPHAALNYISEIKTIGKEPKHEKYLAFFVSIIDLLSAKAHFQMQEYETSIKILDKALKDLQQTGKHFRNEVVESYQIYADAYAALGNYKKAFEYKNIYIQLQDSLTRIEKINIISRLEIRNRMAEKNKELALQKLTLSEINSKVRDKNFWIFGISLFTFSGLVIFGLWRKKNIGKQKLQQERIDNLQQKMDIERLKASITGEEKERTRIGRELHDGIGGLLSVARMNFELARKKNNNNENPDFKDGLKLLEEATVELRKSASNLMPEVLMNQGLDSAVQAYCEKMMSKSKTHIAFQSFGNKADTTSVFDLPIYRIIQELVHNIIKHADAAHSLVQMNYQKDGTINITIEDDGIGLPKDAFEASMGMGLKNMKERVQDLGGKLDIQSTKETGTSIYLEFESFKKI